MQAADRCVVPKLEHYQQVSLYSAVYCEVMRSRLSAKMLNRYESLMKNSFI